MYCEYLPWPWPYRWVRGQVLGLGGQVFGLGLGGQVLGLGLGGQGLGLGLGICVLDSKSVNNTIFSSFSLYIKLWCYYGVKLGVILHQGLSCDLHVSAMLKQCSQRIYLLRMLRSQGLSADHLSTIFVGLIVSCVLYALPAWSVFASVGQSGRIDAFLKRAYKFGFSKDIITFNELLTKSGSSHHCSLKCIHQYIASTISCHQKRSRLTNLETATL